VTDPRYGAAGPGDQGYGPPGSPPRRSRRVLAAAAAAAAVLVIGGGAFVLLQQHKSPPVTKHHHHHGLPATVTVPGCTTATASAHNLGAVRIANVAVGGKPFGVRLSHDGLYTFVSLGNAVAMLKNNGGGLSLTLSQTIQAPGATKGEALTRDGRYLLVADNAAGAVVISTQEAEQGAANPIVGHLSSPGGGGGAVEIAVSPDDKFAFVTLQSSAAMAVFNLQIAESSNFTNSGFVGFVPLGSNPVGIAESPDGTWLYVTSMQRVAGPVPSEGTVSVVSLARAETNPRNAVVSTPATAGCTPSRVMTSADGSVVWVTTQGSNALLAFNAVKLRTDPSHSLIAKVAVGQNPIGETFIKGGAQIVVADSNKSHSIVSSSDLAVVNTKDALAGKPALVGLIRTGMQPREFDLEGGQTLLVSNTGSGQLEAVTIGGIP
jgi:DNA-binding beta-propeller fold protein YncE